MKQKILVTVMAIMSLQLHAQLTDMSTSPDFLFTDINGEQVHLYSYLSQGKVVFVNFSPAWCQECWTYHQTSALQNLYTLYGPEGTDQIRVVFIEKDEVMELADIRGQTTASAGDWVTNTPYPIIDTSAANMSFNPDPLPTIYGIYPDKQIYNLGKLTTEELFAFSQQYNGPTVGPDTMIKVVLDTRKPPSCAGFNDGALALTIDGPGLSYKYAWNNGDTTQDIGGLFEGTYRCTITDNLDNVHIIDPISLAEPDSLKLSFLKSTPTSETANNGSIIANVTGGTNPNSYIWSTGSTDPAIDGLGEGSYSLQVIDGNGCQIQDSATLTIPDCSVVISINVEPTSCDEDPDGKINILIDGGTAPLSFAWSNGETTPNLLNVASGGYELTVTDAIGCTATVGAMVTINDKIKPIVRTRKGPTILYLNQNGAVEVFAEQIDSGSFDNCAILDMQLEQEFFDCTDLGRNFVKFTVIDKNLNLSSKDVEIVVRDTSMPYFLCPEDIIVEACDGIVRYTPPMIVDNCSNGSVTKLEGLGSGASFPLGTSTEKYTYVTNDNIRVECSFNVIVQKKISAEVETRDVTCPGNSDGSATISIGSTNTYSYRWSDGQTTQSAVNLAAGSYSVTVSEENECTFVRDLFIGEPLSLTSRVDSITLPTQNYDIYLSVQGGTPPYRYQWSNGQGTSVSTSQDPKNLANGTYQLLVTDANGCSLSRAIATDGSTAIVDYVLLKNLKLLPNPTSGSFSLEFGAGYGKSATIDILSLTGQQIFRKEIVTQPNSKINPGAIAPGFYLVRVQLGGEVRTKRLVVN